MPLQLLLAVCCFIARLFLGKKAVEKPCATSSQGFLARSLEKPGASVIVPEAA
jgi:hypothetical protein